MIRIDLKSDNVMVGGRVAGHVTWNAEGTKHPRKIEVELRRRFEGKRTDHHIISSIADDNTESRSQIVVPFDFEVPFDQPPSYRGKLITIVWEIYATADLPWAIDEHDTKAVNVMPVAWTAEEYRAHHDDEDEDEDDDDLNESSPGTDQAAR